MPVTKTAKRALRGSARKAERNARQLAALEIALRKARGGSAKAKALAQSLVDRATKKGLLHKNKAARIKGNLSRKSGK